MNRPDKCDKVHIDRLHDVASWLELEDWLVDSERLLRRMGYVRGTITKAVVGDFPAPAAAAFEGLARYTFITEINLCCTGSIDFEYLKSLGIDLRLIYTDVGKKSKCTNPCCYEHMRCTLRMVVDDFPNIAKTDRQKHIDGLKEWIVGDSDTGTFSYEAYRHISFLIRKLDTYRLSWEEPLHPFKSDGIEDVVGYLFPEHLIKVTGIPPEPLSDITKQHGGLHLSFYDSSAYFKNDPETFDAIMLLKMKHNGGIHLLEKLKIELQVG